jgi:signal recognition particle subunit SRP54
VRSGKGFTLEDMRDQFSQMLKMGGMGGLMDKLPGMGKLGADAKQNIDDKDIKRMIAIIDSMTPGERQRPDIIKGSRKRRIANGSGMQVQDVNRLLKQYRDMRDMMKKLSGGGMKKMMRSMKGRMPGLPF